MARMMRQFELVERVKAYDPAVDEEMLNRAYVFSMKKHGAQTRASGDPYFSHPVEVAGILTRLKLDGASIATGLLHDTVEDTDTTLEEIEKLFGGEVAGLVDGVTKLSRVELQSDDEHQAENFLKLLLAMSKDIRVLLVKLADRLHNMRTLKFVQRPEKRQRIARETMEIYAPLAGRIGMEEVKRELEDLAFAEINLDGYESVMARLRFLRQQGTDMVATISADMATTLAAQGVPAQVSGREKSPYSVWRKMQNKEVSFEKLSDIMAFRIVVDNVGQCYQALGVLHGRYSVVPGRFKDYISVPKPNGYRSLHTGVLWRPANGGEGGEGHRIEVQIRTRDMHEQAEQGVAAHWIYKEGRARADAHYYRWLRGLLDIVENAQSPSEAVEHTKLEMFQDQVFCFTPKGRLITLPRGATPVDFAYAVHSQVGDTCVGSRVNGRMVPLRTELRNGDQVEILTSKAQTPSPTWERFVVSGKAKSAIRRFVRLRQREEHLRLGRSLLERAFQDEGYELADKGLQGVLVRFKQGSVDDLVAAVGAGTVSGREVLSAVFPGVKKQARGKGEVVPIGRARTRARAATTAAASGADAIPIVGLIPGLAVHFARCCHPLPGDRIVGIITTGKGVTIHTIDCSTLESFEDTPERWINLAWDAVADAEASKLTGRLNVTLANKQGSLSTLSTVIARNNGNITNLRIVHRSPDFFDMILDIEVADAKHLADITAALRATPAVSTVERARG
jgi:guanosine-3',5'-bis(diphosphate) 3'-pyrophosphohydrolase